MGLFAKLKPSQTALISISNFGYLARPFLKAPKQPNKRTNPGPLSPDVAALSSDTRGSSGAADLYVSPKRRGTYPTVPRFAAAVTRLVLWSVDFQLRKPYANKSANHAMHLKMETFFTSRTGATCVMVVDTEFEECPDR